LERLSQHFSGFVCVLGFDVTRYHGDGHHQNRCVIGKPECGDEIGDQINWGDEIGKGCEQGRAHPPRGLGVGCAIKSAGCILGKGNASGHFQHFFPKAASDRLFIARNHSGKVCFLAGKACKSGAFFLVLAHKL